MGRSLSGRGYSLVNRDLFNEFAALLSSAEWDAALLQEVPPRWAKRLADATDSGNRASLTSRNWMRPLTFPVARIRPHLTGSWEGGCNMILIRKGRPGVSVESHQRATLRLWPERRVVSMARTHSGLCLANLHASTGARADADVLRAARLATDWAGDAPLVLGGDFNTSPAASEVFGKLERLYGFQPPEEEYGIDHLLARGAEVLETARIWPDTRRDVPDTETELFIRLSDHAPAVCRVSA